MILINCPYCGEREQSEFTNGGEAHVIRPKDPDTLSDKEWGQYVFYRSNPKGIFYERWVHSHTVVENGLMRLEILQQIQF